MTLSPYLTFAAPLALLAAACDAPTSQDTADSAQDAQSASEIDEALARAEGGPAVNDTADAPSGDEPDPSACGADKLGDMVGKTLTESARAEIERKVDHGRIRYIGPDTIVTMDLRPDRLNVETDAEDTITRIRCG